ncbi:MAG TPA: hypothetical protein VF035_04430 [Longimicrobiales bacterium]
MGRNTRDRMPLIAAALFVVLGTAVVATGGWLARGSRAGGLHAYVPDGTVPRISFSGDPVDASMVRDFDVLDGELYLLDVAASRVVVLADSSGEWKAVRSFGRPGQGPGELNAPSGIAVLPVTGEVIIADNSVLHRFTRAGEYIETQHPALPCTLGLPHLDAVGDALLLSGRCLHGDTMRAELHWLPRIQADTAVRVAYDPLYSISNGGSPFAASAFFGGGGGHGLFGGGASGCLARVDLQSRPPAATTTCAVAASRYALVPDEELKQKSKALAASRPWAAAAFELPDELPVFLDRVVWDGRDYLLRPFSTDSAVLREVGSEKDLVITGLTDLIGCREAGCLWVSQEDVPRVMFLPRDRILP